MKIYYYFYRSQTYFKSSTPKMKTFVISTFEQTQTANEFFDFLSTKNMSLYVRGKKIENSDIEQRKGYENVVYRWFKLAPPRLKTL